MVLCGDRRMFVMPESQRMTFPRYMELSETSTAVYYISHQNNSLRDDDEFTPLLADIQPELPFALEAFGCPPEAVNFWYVVMTLDRAVC